MILVGTVGIENHTERNFKDFEEAMGEREDIENVQQGMGRNSCWPLEGPSFFDSERCVGGFTHQLACEARLRFKFRGPMASRLLSFGKVELIV